MARLRSECIACLLRHHIKAADKDAPEDKKREYIQSLLSVLAEAPKDISTPLMIEKIVQVRNKYFPIINEYGPIKHRFNALMLDCAPAAREKIRSSADPLKAAIQLSIVGNFIDFGAMDDIDEAKLMELLDTYQEISVDEAELSRLKRDLKSARSLSLLADNCGEIVMDKLMLEEIKRQCPEIKISVIVRGEPVINDVTMEDAVQVGLMDEFTVVGNGSSICGTVPERLSPESSEIFEQSDIILSKGQANFEGLHHCGRNVYYIFLCKCGMFAELFGVKQFSGILASDEKVSREIFL